MVDNYEKGCIIFSVNIPVNLLGNIMDMTEGTRTLWRTH